MMMITLQVQQSKNIYENLFELAYKNIAKHRLRKTAANLLKAFVVNYDVFESE